MTYLPRELYSQIHANMPIPCVDAVILHDQKILLLRRSNQPAQGQWWFPGGRVHKGETLTGAVQRKMQEEIGQPVTIIAQLGTDETIFPDGPFGGPTHTINTVFLVTPTQPEKLSITDDQHDEITWFETPLPDLDPYISKYISIALA